ncbi:MAG: hypothetical protein Q8O67_14705 [Deltaproteobacteria bacterium]|nr:hypothetical protein [Deltaproteobacteria bacterium]
MRMLARVLVLLPALSACTQFDRQDQVKDLRVLAARTEPAEIFYDAAAPFIPVDVTFSVFAYDPRGGSVTTTVELCAPDDETQCTPLGTNEGVADPEDPAGRVTNAEFTVSIDDALFRSFVSTLSFTSALPTFQIVVENEGASGVTEELAFKRLPFTLDLATLPPPLAGPIEQIYGVPLCTPASPEAPPEPPLEPGTAVCVQPVPPNLSPVLVGFDIGSGDPAEEVIIADAAAFPPHAVLTAAAGSELRIDPVLAEGSIEHHQVQTLDLVSSALGLDNRTEDIAVTWTSTAGDVGRATTVISDESGLGIVWRLPEGKAGDRCALVVVVFDQRGGIVVGQVDVELE